MSLETSVKLMIFEQANTHSKTDDFCWQALKRYKITGKARCQSFCWSPSATFGPIWILSGHTLAQIHYKTKGF